MDNEIREFTDAITNIRTELMCIKVKIDHTIKHLDTLRDQKTAHCNHIHKERETEYGSNRTSYTCLDCGRNI